MGNIKIKDIILSNFKYFKDEVPIKLNGNNALIYGENGSGKSSIYWALYTFFESSIKESKQISKYFEPEGKESLVNRYAKMGDKSFIDILFTDNNSYKISKTDFDTHIDTIVEATKTSVFLNYKYLFKIHDFKNSQEMEIFDIMAAVMLKGIYISDEDEEYESYSTDSDDYDESDDFITTEDLECHWNDIKDGLKRGKGNRKIRLNEKLYKDYDNKVNAFNDKMRNFLDLIKGNLNELLVDYFKQDLRVGLYYEDALIVDGGKERSYNIAKPKVVIRIQLLSPKVYDPDVPKPHTFLNEAKLSIISLSIYLAVVKQRLAYSEIEIAVFDDMLLSLDMCYQREIVEYILDNFEDFQIVFLTHDRDFYHKFKQINKIKGIDKNWRYFELYCDETDEGIEQPFLDCQDKDNISRAEFHLRHHDYPACANYLRKAFEQHLKRITPEVYIYKVQPFKELTLNNLIIACYKFCNDYLIEDECNLRSIIKSLDYLKNVMDIFSHHNVKNPLYKVDLSKALEQMIELSNIDVELLYDRECSVGINIPHIGLWEFVSVKPCYCLRNLQDIHYLKGHLECKNFKIEAENFTGDKREKAPNDVDTPIEFTQRMRRIEHYLNNNGVTISLQNDIVSYLYIDDERYKPISES